MDKIFALCIFVSVLLLVVAVIVANQQRRQHFVSLITLENLRNKVVKKQRKGYLENLESKAKKAGLSLGSLELFIVALLSCAIIFTAGLIFLSQPFLAALVSILGFLLPEKVLDHLISKRATLMLGQLVKFLPTVANFLRAGYSLPQAISLAGSKAAEPLRAIFTDIQTQMDAGTNVIKALENAAESVPLTEFKLIVLATKINSQIGGNLPDIYETISETISDRLRMAEQQRAYTTEGRMSANIVGGIVFGMIALFRLISPDYFNPLLETTLGQVFFAICIGMTIFGWFAVRKIAEPKF